MKKISSNYFCRVILDDKCLKEMPIGCRGLGCSELKLRDVFSLGNHAMRFAEDEDSIFYYIMWILSVKCENEWKLVFY